MKPQDKFAEIDRIKKAITPPKGMPAKMATAKAIARIVTDEHYRRHGVPCSPQVTVEFQEAATLMCDWLLEKVKKQMEDYL